MTSRLTNESVTMTHAEQTDLIAKLELLSNADIAVHVPLEEPPYDHGSYMDAAEAERDHRLRTAKMDLVSAGLARSLQHFLEAAWDIDPAAVRERKCEITGRR